MRPHIINVLVVLFVLHLPSSTSSQPPNTPGVVTRAAIDAPADRIAFDRYWHDGVTTTRRLIPRERRLVVFEGARGEVSCHATAATRLETAWVDARGQSSGGTLTLQQLTPEAEYRCVALLGGDGEERMAAGPSLLVQSRTAVKFVESPESTHSSLGDAVRLACAADAPVEDIYWTRNDEPFDAATIETAAGRSLLHLTLSAEYLGEYRCCLPHSNATSRPARLQLANREGGALMLARPAVSVHSARDELLECLPRRGRVTWHRRGDDGKLIFVSNSTILRVPAGTSAVFECRTPADTFTTLVSLPEQPDFASGRIASVDEWDLGGASLHCSAHADQESWRLRWLRGGVELKSGGRVEIARRNHAGKITSTMFIAALQQEDLGMYSCVLVSSSNDTFESSTHFLVQPTQFSQVVTRLEASLDSSGDLLLSWLLPLPHTSLSYLLSYHSDTSPVNSLLVDDVDCEATAGGRRCDAAQKLHLQPNTSYTLYLAALLDEQITRASAPATVHTGDLPDSPSPHSATPSTETGAECGERCGCSRSPFTHHARLYWPPDILAEHGAVYRISARSDGDNQVAMESSRPHIDTSLLSPREQWRVSVRVAEDGEVRDHLYFTCLVATERDGASRAPLALWVERAGYRAVTVFWIRPRYVINDRLPHGFHVKLRDVESGKEHYLYSPGVSVSSLYFGRLPLDRTYVASVAAGSKSKNTSDYLESGTLLLSSNSTRFAPRYNPIRRVLVEQYLLIGVVCLVVILCCGVLYRRTAYQQCAQACVSYAAPRTEHQWSPRSSSAPLMDRSSRGGSSRGSSSRSTLIA